MVYTQNSDFDVLTNNNDHNQLILKVPTINYNNIFLDVHVGNCQGMGFIYICDTEPRIPRNEGDHKSNMEKESV